jgi:hypothetical protein
MSGMEIVSHRQTWNKLIFVTTKDTKGKALSSLPGSAPVDMFGSTGNKVLVAAIMFLGKGCLFCT